MPSSLAASDWLSSVHHRRRTEPHVFGLRWCILNCIPHIGETFLAHWPRSFNKSRLRCAAKFRSALLVCGIVIGFPIWPGHSANSGHNQYKTCDLKQGYWLAENHDAEQHRNNRIQCQEYSNARWGSLSQCPGEQIICQCSAKYTDEYESHPKAIKVCRIGRLGWAPLG
jgi:hypothetical protein